MWRLLALGTFAFGVLASLDLMRAHRLAAFYSGDACGSARVVMGDSGSDGYCSIERGSVTTSWSGNSARLGFGPYHRVGYHVWVTNEGGGSAGRLALVPVWAWSVDASVYGAWRSSANVQLMAVPGRAPVISAFYFGPKAGVLYTLDSPTGLQREAAMYFLLAGLFLAGSVIGMLAPVRK